MLTLFDMPRAVDLADRSIAAAESDDTASSKLSLSLLLMLPPGTRLTCSAERNNLNSVTTVEGENTQSSTLSLSSVSLTRNLRKSTDVSSGSQQAQQCHHRGRRDLSKQYVIDLFVA